jgi:hypothetical protein
MDEARANYLEIVQLTKTHPQNFTPEDLKKIELNGQFFNK